MTLNRVLISGGGTGGHIFPALSIAAAIKRRNPDAEILFVGALGRMEMEKYLPPALKSWVCPWPDSTANGFGVISECCSSCGRACAAPARL